MRAFQYGLSVVAFALLTVAGCQRLNVEKTVDVDPAEIKGTVIDGPKSEQKIKVEFNSTASPINVHVVLGKDDSKVIEELFKPAPKLDIRGKAEKSQSGTVEATIPAGQDYGVYLSGAKKKTQVSLKIKSQ